jgi:hypothetical protein
LSPAPTRNGWQHKCSHRLRWGHRDADGWNRGAVNVRDFRRGRGDWPVSAKYRYVNVLTGAPWSPTRADLPAECRRTWGDIGSVVGGGDSTGIARSPVSARPGSSMAAFRRRPDGTGARTRGRHGKHRGWWDGEGVVRRHPCSQLGPSEP